MDFIKDNLRFMWVEPYGEHKGNHYNERGRFLLFFTLLLTGLLLVGVIGAGADNYKLSGPLGEGGYVYQDYSISPDSSRVVYRAAQDSDHVVDLYSVPLTGGMPVKLNPSFGKSIFWWAFCISPDSSRVVYFADQDTNYVFELYSVPLTGGMSVKLNGPLADGGQVWATGNQFSPDGSRVVYRAEQDTYGVFELYSVPPTGGAPVKLNQPLPDEGEVPWRFSISSDNSRVVYYVLDEYEYVVGDPPLIVTVTTRDLYSVPLIGGTPVKLNAPFLNGGSVIGATISSDSTRVVYIADDDTNDAAELYSVPLAGGAVIKLNGPLAVGGDILDFAISPDSNRVVYRADQDTDGVAELYSVPLTGGMAVKLNDPLVAGGSVGDPDDSGSHFLIASDSSRVVYRADQDAHEVFELYSVPLTGGPSVKLNGPLIDGGDVWTDFVISSDGSGVVYRADQEVDNVFELYGVPMTGGMPIKLNGPLVEGGGVRSYFSMSPDDSRVVYWADQDTEGLVELYAATLEFPAVLGDLDSDGDVDRNDVELVLDGRGQAADGPDDPRDVDGDGIITVGDARAVVELCTRPSCATE